MSPHSFRALLVFIALLTVATWFFDYLHPMFGSDEQQLLAYSGFGSHISFGSWFAWSYLALYLVSLVGLFFFERPARVLFAALLLVNVLILPFMGMLIATGIERAMGDAGSILSGLVLGLAYTAPLNERFAL